MARQHPSKTKDEIASPQTKSNAIARSSTHPIEELQGAIGNRAVNRLVANQPPLPTKPLFRGLSHQLQLIQPKLTIGALGDKYEQEADHVAEQVVNQINAPASQSPRQSQSIQRQEIPEEDDELQMKSVVQRLASGDSKAIAPNLETSIQRARGSGKPLAQSIQQPMEGAFGADFSRVRVHTDAKSDRLNRSIQAKAFTTGSDIFFRQGDYEPSSRVGQELIAHELTHVVQQRRTGVNPPSLGTSTKLQEWKENGAIKPWERVKQTEQEINQVQLTTEGIDIQLYKDLKQLYKYNEKDDNAKAWLDDYIKIQELLADKTRVKIHLKALSQSMIPMPGGLDAALSASEAGTWTDVKPILTGFVPASEFERIVGNGQIFVDLVAKNHGRQTHRIQWFCIRREAEENKEWLTHSARDLYKNSVDLQWKTDSQKNMWDAIVDGTETEIYDFTRPENLEAYLSEDWLPLWYSRQRRLRPILQEVRKEHKNQPADKKREENNWKRNASREEQKKGHKAQDRVTVGEYIYTGFYANEPTVMYKSDQDPDARV